MYKKVNLCILNDSPKIKCQKSSYKWIHQKEVFVANTARIFYNDLLKKCKVRKHQFFDKITCDKQDKMV